MKLSVIIPTFNEGQLLANCVKSLLQQEKTNFEIIVVDDGSTDSSVDTIENLSSVKVLHEAHLGPGAARNQGAKQATGEILVFVDADMVFDRYFLYYLTLPIVSHKALGTFSKEEKVANSEKKIARFWQFNLGIKKGDKMIPENYPDTAPVFRAILKSEFDRVGGFDDKLGYTDDWSLSRKLGYKSKVATGAIYYHVNPEKLVDVFSQAIWIGKNEFMAGNLLRKIRTLIMHSLPISLIKGSVASVELCDFHYLWFKMIYDGGICWGTFRTFFSDNKNK